MKPLEEPLESLRQLLQEARPKIDRPIEIILIGGAAALLSEAIKRITEDIDVLASTKTVSILQKAGALRFPIQPVADSFLCLHPDYRSACKYVRELSFPPKIRVFRLSPLDLAISKLSRFQQVDVEDIEAILRKDKIDRKTLVRRYATHARITQTPKTLILTCAYLFERFMAKNLIQRRTCQSHEAKPKQLCAWKFSPQIFHVLYRKKTASSCAIPGSTMADLKRTPKVPSCQSCSIFGGTSPMR